MSGPNSNYDPVEVTPLHADSVAAMRDEAIAAIVSAADLEQLKAARLAHAGRPLAARPREPGDRRAATAGAQGGRNAGR